MDKTHALFGNKKQTKKFVNFLSIYSFSHLLVSLNFLICKINIFWIYKVSDNVLEKLMMIRKTDLRYGNKINVITD